MTKQPVRERIGLVGIGLVGTALGERLLGRGFGVIGFDIDPSKCRRLEALGGQAAGGPADVAAECRRVFLSLMTTEIVREVVEAPGGLMHAATPPKYIIDTTTGDPDQTAELAGRLARRGVHFLDATISGSSGQVRGRQAVFLVGGAPEAFHACGDLFDAVTEKAFHVGPSGCGCKAKLASNLILGLNRAALAEGLVFAEKLGLEPAPFLALLKASPAYSAAMDVKGERMLTGDFAPVSRIAQHHKDVSIILEYAERLGQELPLSRAHAELLRTCIEAGDGELDNAAVIREIRRRGHGKR